MRPVLLLMIVFAARTAAEAQLLNRVTVESKFVRPGDTGVVIGVFIENAIPIQALVLPLEIRSESGAAYVRSHLFHYGLDPLGRVYNSPLGVPHPPGCASDGDAEDCLWPVANRVLVKTAAPVLPDCSGPKSHTWTNAGANIDELSPDGLFFATVSTGDTSVGHMIFMQPGADSVNPSLRIRTSIYAYPGVFEIDTCCWRPASHLAFYGSVESLILPDFVKGVITVRDCNCDCGGDPGRCDGVADIVDVVETINVAFRDGTPIPEPNANCQYITTDVNCSSTTDLIDVYDIINVVFRGDDAASTLCYPCP